MKDKGGLEAKETIIIEKLERDKDNDDVVEKIVVENGKIVSHEKREE